MRAVLGAGETDQSEVVLDTLELDEEMVDMEFGDLAALYSGQRINFCDFSQFVLACGEHLHPCYHDNVIEVLNISENTGIGIKNVTLAGGDIEVPEYHVLAGRIWTAK